MLSNIILVAYDPGGVRRSFLHFIHPVILYQFIYTESTAQWAEGSEASWVAKSLNKYWNLLAYVT